MRHKVRIIHGVLNYFLAAVMVSSPLFLAVEESAAANLSMIIAGLASLCLGLVSNYELGVIKSVRYKDNLIINAVLGTLLILCPFVFGFAEVSFAKHVTFGLLQIILPLIVYKIHFYKKRSALQALFQ